MSARKKKNSSKFSIVVSLVFHGVLILAAFFLAAREGMLGKKLKEITVTMAPKEKKPEPPKEKLPEPKAEPPKAAEAPKQTAPAPARTETAATPPPAMDVPPMAAPPSVALPAFEFSDGAKQVETTSDARQLYKGLVEYTLRSKWKRPEDIQDAAFVAEIELSMEPDGKITDWQWKSGSGDKRWDDSVKAAVQQVKTISRPPPKGFPARVNVRFDVEMMRTESLQLSSQ